MTIRYGGFDNGSFNNTNTSLSYTTNDDFCTSSTVFTAIYTTVSTIFAVIAIFGNVISLVIIKEYPAVRGPNNKYLLTVHLKVLNIIFSAVLFTYLFEISTYDLLFSATRQALVISLFICNGGCMFITACRRLFVSSFPFYYYRKKRVEERFLSVILVILWIISFTVGFHSFSTYKTDKDVDKVLYWSAMYLSPKSTTLIVAVFFVFTSVSILFYTTFYIMFRISNNRLNKTSNRIPLPTVSSMLMIFMFTVCWLPYCCVIITQGTSSMPCCLCSYMLLVGFINTGCSWTINFIINPVYRNSLTDLFS